MEVILLFEKKKKQSIGGGGEFNSTKSEFGNVIDKSIHLNRSKDACWVTDC